MTTVAMTVLLCLAFSNYGAHSFSTFQSSPVMPRPRATTTTEHKAAAAVLDGTVQATRDVSALLEKNRKVVDSLGAVAASIGDGSDDVDIAGGSELARLRFAMAFETEAEAVSAYRESLSCRRSSKGAESVKSIVDSARDAYDTATIGGGWDNDVVRNTAPHSGTINKYITAENIVTLSDGSGDLVYVIRASTIDDKAMMDEVTVDQMSDFFLYVKEIHSLVANRRSEQTGRLVEVIFANDITGVRKPPDSRFSKALSSSSGQYEKLYPSLAGPTMILNLPRILQAFVALFKPLFPKAVQERLKFVRAPVLAALPDLTPLVSKNKNSSERKEFLAETAKLLTE